MTSTGAWRVQVRRYPGVVNEVSKEVCQSKRFVTKGRGNQKGTAKHEGRGDWGKVQSIARMYATRALKHICICLCILRSTYIKPHRATRPQPHTAVKRLYSVSSYIFKSVAFWSRFVSTHPSIDLPHLGPQSILYAVFVSHLWIKNLVIGDKKVKYWSRELKINSSICKLHVESTATAASRQPSATSSFSFGAGWKVEWKQNSARWTVVLRRASIIAITH